jgi:5-formyltetrahydrofolate cyclo-ligase
MQSARHFKRSLFILPSNSKPELRAELRDIRRRISLSYRKQAAQAAAEILTQQDIFKRSEHIACYFSFGDEFDAMPIMEAVWQAKKNCYLPVLTETNSLAFFAYNKGDALGPNRYSIQEPVNVLEEFNVEDLDLVIAPLIGFDLQGRRLGTGGGYYDRTFSFIKKNPVHRPYILGLGYASQQEESLPQDEWDVGLDAMLTENEFIDWRVSSPVIRGSQ